ncbi:LytR/AlgR family response regulator transcription factor [Paraliobacillus sp. JSM ZJ581]|uniref:LytR/AlgR family response regulator transcription factor n=1 Tax=Paraliobacillus sp. JSM ZJ581 TaxID=3342118 RepID=UPI0035A8E54C
MSIFIYEDDIIQGNQFKRLAEEICEKHQIPFDFIEVTSKSDQIIEKIPLTTFIPIYFLDIEIKKERRKGLQVAQKIRRHDSLGIIVFVTTHSEFAPISYQYMVSAFTFIDKALSYNERYHLIKQCLSYYEVRNQTNIPTDDFIVENTNTTIKVPFKTVEYIATDGPHRLVLVTSEQVIHFYGTLKEIANLDNRLFRCHQSFIVNMNQIASYDKTNRMIILRNNERIPVSRRLSSKIRQMIKDGV